MHLPYIMTLFPVLDRQQVPVVVFTYPFIGPEIQMNTPLAKLLDCPLVWGRATIAPIPCLDCKEQYITIAVFPYRCVCVCVCEEMLLRCCCVAGRVM